MTNGHSSVREYNGKRQFADTATYLSDGTSIGIDCVQGKEIAGHSLNRLRRIRTHCRTVYW